MPFWRKNERKAEEPVDSGDNELLGRKVELVKALDRIIQKVPKWEASEIKLNQYVNEKPIYRGNISYESSPDFKVRIYFGSDEIDILVWHQDTSNPFTLIYSDKFLATTGRDNNGRWHNDWELWRYAYNALEGTILSLLREQENRKAEAKSREQDIKDKFWNG